MTDTDFESTVTFKSSPDAVYDALTTPSGLAGWWCPDVSGSGLEGGELTFRFGDTGQVVMRVDKAKQPSAVRWTTLASEPLPDWVGTTLSFDVSPENNGGSRLHFRHSGLTPQLECFDFCSTSWKGYLASLASYLYTGKGSPFGSVGSQEAERT